MGREFFDLIITAGASAKEQATNTTSASDRLVGRCFFFGLSQSSIILGWLVRLASLLCGC
jgi:hypothetical protein